MTARATAMAAVKTRLDTAALPGLTVLSRWPQTIYVPSAGCLAVVECPSMEYGLTFGADMSLLTVNIHLLVSISGDIENADALIDPYISNTGTSSVLQAIRGDPYLGTTVSYAKPPTGVRDIGVRHFGPEDSGFDLFGATIPLEVIVS